MAYKNGDGKIPTGRFSLLLRWLRNRNGDSRQEDNRNEKQNERQLNISFFGGKGGVGKTTCSALFAFSLAKKGHKTLLVSTDPAHSLGDLLEVDADSQQQIAPGLTVMELDSERASNRYINEVKGNLEKLTAPEMWKEVERQVDFAKASPGADEAALFDELVTIILDAEGNFDHIVFDTAPTGHTLRLLSLPDLMEVWMEGMLAQRKKSQEMNRMLNNIAGVREEEPADQVYHLLQRRKHRFSMVKKLLLDPEKTTFYFVLNPERLPILETEKAMGILEKHHIKVGGIIINRVLPEDADGTFLEKRREQEKIYVKEIEEKFSSFNKIYIPMQSSDIKGIDGINQLAPLMENLTN